MGFNMTGEVGPRGKFGVSRVPRSDALLSLTWAEVREKAYPKLGLSDEVNEWRLANMRKVRRRFKRIRRAQKFHAPLIVGSFGLRRLDAVGNPLVFGVAGLDVITNEFVSTLTDHMQSSTGGIDLFRYHAIGTGSSAASAADGALGTELSATGLTAGGRAIGTQTEGASTNIYETVGTNTVNSTRALREVGVFNSSVSQGAAILVDRDVYAVINLSSGESLQSTCRPWLDHAYLCRDPICLKQRRVLQPLHQNADESPLRHHWTATIRRHVVDRLTMS